MKEFLLPIITSILISLGIISPISQQANLGAPSFNYIVGTSTMETRFAEGSSTTTIKAATSTFAGNVSIIGRTTLFGSLNASSTATTTLSNGIQLYGGCFRDVSGSCIVGGSGADGSFSTTSADYWDTTVFRWATTSSNYWLTTKTTDNLTQGSSNLYYSTQLFASDLAGTTTTALNEGTNLYWTNTRFDNRLSATSSISGVTTLPNLSLPSTQVTGLNTFGYPFPNNATSSILNFTGGLTSNASTTIGTLNLANQLTVGNGGTGAISFTAGQLLVGNGTGALTSTSTANLKSSMLLNLVENTALSSWAGSSNITTLGTLGSLSVTGTTTSGGFYLNSGSIRFADGTYQTTAASGGVKSIPFTISNATTSSHQSIGSFKDAVTITQIDAVMDCQSLCNPDLISGSASTPSVHASSSANAVGTSMTYPITGSYTGTDAVLITLYAEGTTGTGDNFTVTYAGAQMSGGGYGNPNDQMWWAFINATSSDSFNGTKNIVHASSQSRNWRSISVILTGVNTSSFANEFTASSTLGSNQVGATNYVANNFNAALNDLVLDAFYITSAEYPPSYYTGQSQFASVGVGTSWLLSSKKTATSTSDQTMGATLQASGGWGSIGVSVRGSLLGGYSKPQGILFNLMHGINRNASTTSTNLFTDKVYTNSSTTLTSFTSFEDATLGAGEQLWLPTGGITSSSSPVNLDGVIYYQ